MMPTRTSWQRRRLIQAAGALCAIGTASALHAQPTWPAKPIRVVVGFAPGGGTDVMARILGPLLTETLGQIVIVDNKPGASGNLGTAEVIRARADGYTFLIAPTSVETANPSLFKANINPANDLVPVATIGRTQMYLIAKNQLPVKDAKELVAMAKANPDKLSYGSAGAGTPPHLAGELFNQRTGVSVVHVPYKGSAPALQDLLAGQVDYVFDPGIAFSHVRAGKVKMLAVASSTRSPFFPDVPTLAELGFKGAELDIWFGMWAPKGVPPDILARISHELAKALALPNVKQRYADLGAEAIFMDTAEFRKLLASETKVLSALIKERKIIVD